MASNATGYGYVLLLVFVFGFLYVLFTMPPA